PVDATVCEHSNYGPGGRHLAFTAGKVVSAPLALQAPSVQSDAHHEQTRQSQFRTACQRRSLESLQGYDLPAEDRFPDAWRPASTGAGASGEVGGGGYLRPAARGCEGAGGEALHAARWPSLCERAHPHRHEHEQDPEGSGGAYAADDRVR